MRTLSLSLWSVGASYVSICTPELIINLTRPNNNISYTMQPKHVQNAGDLWVSYKKYYYFLYDQSYKNLVRVFIIELFVEELFIEEQSGELICD
jgi:hypothetical protein